MEDIVINEEYITLGQLLKETGLIDTGGMAKWFLAEHTVYLNGEQEQRRGKKLFPDDVIDIKDVGSFRIVAHN